jgi:hypothetical protein
VDFFRWWDGRYAVVEELAPPPIDGTALQPGEIILGAEELDPETWTDQMFLYTDSKSMS